MTEHEFEQYLRLLAGMLRLNADQRREIAAELRDHLELRLAELVEQGLSREKAILMALEAFGDSAGLAREFSVIFRQQQRSRFMKLTAASMVSLTAAVLLFMAMTPENARVHLARTSVAQNRAIEPPSSPTDPFQPNKPNQPDKPKKDQASVQNARLTAEPGESVQENNAATEAKLAKRTAVSFTSTSFREMVKFVSEVADVQIYVDQRSLEEQGVSMDAVVDLEFTNVRIDMAIDLSLRQINAECAYVIRDGIIVIATKDKIEENMEVRVYDCGELFRLAAL